MNGCSAFATKYTGTIVTSERDERQHERDAVALRRSPRRTRQRQRGPRAHCRARSGRWPARSSRLAERATRSKRAIGIPAPDERGEQLPRCIVASLDLDLHPPPPPIGFRRAATRVAPPAATEPPTQRDSARASTPSSESPSAIRRAPMPARSRRPDRGCMHDDAVAQLERLLASGASRRAPHTRAARPAPREETRGTHAPRVGSRLRVGSSSSSTRGLPQQRARDEQPLHHAGGELPDHFRARVRRARRRRAPPRPARPSSRGGNAKQRREQLEILPSRQPPVQASLVGQHRRDDAANARRVAARHRVRRRWPSLGRA